MWFTQIPESSMPSSKSSSTPQKSNIDTQNGHILKGSPDPNHHFGYPAVIFFGDIVTLDFIVVHPSRLSKTTAWFEATLVTTNTLTTTDKAPENQWVESIKFPLGPGLFPGYFTRLVGFGEGSYCTTHASRISRVIKHHVLKLMMKLCCVCVISLYYSRDLFNEFTKVTVTIVFKPNLPTIVKSMYIQHCKNIGKNLHLSIYYIYTGFFVLHVFHICQIYAHRKCNSGDPEAPPGASVVAITSDPTNGFFGKKYIYIYILGDSELGNLAMFNFQGICVNLKGIWKTISSWWLNQPIWKICSSKWVENLPQSSGWK